MMGSSRMTRPLVQKMVVRCFLVQGQHFKQSVQKVHHFNSQTQGVLVSMSSIAMRTVQAEHLHRGKVLVLCSHLYSSSLQSLLDVHALMRLFSENIN